MEKRTRLSSKNKLDPIYSAKQGNERWLIERKTTIPLSIFFNPSNPKYTAAWNELYCEYLNTIKKKHRKFFKAIVELDKRLAPNQKMKSIFLLFEKIVPTIDPTDFSPLELLENAIVDAEEYGNYNKLCLFIQIATFKLKELEERFTNDCTHRKLLLQRKKYGVIDIIHPLFALIVENGKGFSRGYDEDIIPELIEHEEYLLDAIKKCTENIKTKDKKKWHEYVGIGNEIKGLYKELKKYLKDKETELQKSLKNIEKKDEIKLQKCLKGIEKKDEIKLQKCLKDKKEEDIKELKDRQKEKMKKIAEWLKKRQKEKTKKNAELLKDRQKEKMEIDVKRFKSSLTGKIFNMDILKDTYFRNRFNEWKATSQKTENVLVISSVKLIIPTSYITKVFWSPLPPWPINEYLKAYSDQECTESALNHSVMDEIWKVIPN